MSNFVVHQQVAIRADLTAVWDALTNPSKTKKYFFNCEVHSTWLPGSAIVFEGRMFWFFKIALHGTILDVQPGRLLKYELYNSGNSGKSVVTEELHFQDGVTFLSIWDDVGDERGAEKRFSKSEKGWKKVLNGLKQLLELER
ncbi:MAG: SRPBCC domain-containing protein [Chitinophagales bacterium]